jgi:hypothetical protein
MCIHNVCIEFDVIHTHHVTRVDTISKRSSMPANNPDLHTNKAARPIGNLKLSNFNIGSMSSIHMVVGLCGVTANVFAPTAIDPSDGCHFLVS